MPQKEEWMRCQVKNRAIWAALILVLALGACSRPAKLTQAPAKAAADATLLLAQNLEQKQRYLDGAQAYQSALAQYRSFADLRGELYALAGLARLAYRQNDLGEYDKLHQRLQYLTTYADQTGHYVLLVLDLFRLQQEGRYAEIQARAIDSYDYPMPIRIQILTYKLQAESYLRPGYSSQNYDTLQRLSKRYRRDLNRDFTADPSVLSSALYALAYHDFLSGDYNAAQKLLDQVVELDSLYENHPGLGYAHWLRAMVHEANNDRRQALKDYISAKIIFVHFADEDMINKVETALIRLEGVEP